MATLTSTPPPTAPRYVRVLSIAGSDSGGGAGIQADLKTFSALGCYGMTAITALTAQNTQGVRAIHGVPPDMLRAQIEAVVEDIGVDAVKIGMLHAPEVVQVVAQAIRRYQLPHVVLDPVMVATSGDRLIAEETVGVLVRELFPLASVVTPNLDEAALLLGRPIEGIGALDEAAQALLALGAPAALLKGGHLPASEVVDVLAQPGGRLLHLRAPRIATHNGHGTGCTLSSAIAAFLALGACRTWSVESENRPQRDQFLPDLQPNSRAIGQKDGEKWAAAVDLQPTISKSDRLLGHDLPDAVQKARAYILGAIAAGAAVHTGQGHGPLNHGYAPVAQVVR